MVVAGKVFRIADEVSLSDLVPKLQPYRIEEPYKEDTLECTLISEITDLVAASSVVRGTLSHDYVIHVLHRGKAIPVPQTVTALFNFDEFKDEIVLTVVQNKKIANFTANKLSTILFGKIGHILEARITPETIKQFQEDNPDDTKVTFFDNLDIPNMDKLSLYGVDLKETREFEEYKKHGDLWYLVGRDKAAGHLIGLTREASITVFNLTDKEQFLEYTADTIYPLISLEPIEPAEDEEDDEAKESE